MYIINRKSNTAATHLWHIQIYSNFLASEIVWYTQYLQLTNLAPVHIYDPALLTELIIVLIILICTFMWIYSEQATTWKLQLNVHLTFSHGLYLCMSYSTIGTNNRHDQLNLQSIGNDESATGFCLM